MSQGRPEKLGTLEEVKYGLEKSETVDEVQDGLIELGTMDDREEKKPPFNPGYDVFPNIDNPK
ncbi:MAG: hypothetical protein ACMUIM_05675 [bacterium]